jgi:hypothetical protein
MCRYESEKGRRGWSGTYSLYWREEIAKIMRPSEKSMSLGCNHQNPCHPLQGRPGTLSPWSEAKGAEAVQQSFGRFRCAPA